MMKKLRFLLAILLFSKICNAQTLHLIMVSDYADPKFGIVSQADEEAVDKIFKTAATFLDYKLNISYLNSNNNLFNSISIKKALDTLKAKPNDIIMFFYSGLGYYPKNNLSTFPTFQLTDFKESTLSVNEIALLLEKKGVRLGIVLAECRDSSPEPKTKEIADLVVTEDLRKMIIKKLFLENCGIWKIASASKGNPTWKHPFFNISAFMNSFDKIFAKTLDTPANQFSTLNFENILLKTQGRMENVLEAYIPKDKPQISHWEFKPYKKIDKKIIQYPASTFVIPDIYDLQNQLTILVNTSDEEERKKAISSISEMCKKNAQIELKTKDVQQSKTILTIEQYIAQTANYDKQTKRTIFIHPYDFKRSTDYKKFVSLKITEK